MAIISLNRDNYLIDDGNAPKIVITDLAGIPGGRALDVNGWSEDVIRAGHIIKINAAGDYAPLGVSDGAYVALEEGESYAGVLKVAVLKDKAMAAILTMGEINASACPYPISKAIADAMPQIKFLYM